jgi:MFS family permease
MRSGVIGIGAASFFADTGHEIPTALLPSLLTATLGAPASALGVIEGVSDGLAGIARLGGGALADDPHRRRSIAVGGYTTTAVLSAAVGGATAPWQAAVLRAGAWTARGLRVPARNALLADIVPASVYGRAYGFERAMDNLGAIAGPALALVLIALTDTRTAIALSVIPGLLAAAAVLYAIRHSPQPKHHDRQPIRIRIKPVLEGGLGRLFMGIGAFELANCAATLLILRATQLFEPTYGIERSTELAVALYIAYNVAATIASFPAGHRADRTSPTKVLAAGAALFTAGYTWFAIGSANPALLAPAFVLAGAGIGCAETAEHAAVATNAPDRLRGSAFGLLAVVQSTGNLAASTIAGLLWTVASPAIAFAFLATVMAAATAGIITAAQPPAPENP